MIVSAFLRSYLPQGSLPQYLEHARPVSSSIRGNDHFLWREPLMDDAYQATWEDDIYVCPRHSRLRMLEGVLAFSNAFPDTGLIPEPQVVDASTQLEELRNQSSAMRSYILTSPWHVPIRWFSAFLHDERELYERNGAMSVRYRTRLGDAQQRVERAAQIVEGAGFDTSVVDQVRALASWLNGFPEEGMVELDYGSVGELFSEGDLVLDESAADTAASLLALEQGNYEEAGAFYGNVARRWGRLQSLAFAN
jgi:hypothetical protein